MEPLNKWEENLNWRKSSPQNDVEVWFFGGSGLRVNLPQQDMGEDNGQGEWI